ncbi:MAG: ATP-dependent sacrificial sulfur transferase LarE [bacterium]|nr:ATP-dependent sacrificial sulfur transferase LarE [bacterium]
MTADLETRLATLRALLGRVDSALVAFSGGVDSSFLLRVAHEVLGPRCLALTTVSAATPEHDLVAARQLAAALGVEHLVVPTDELAVPGYAENPVDRCYFCKDNLFVLCRGEADRRGIAVVVDGANRDDLGDHRPGLDAASAHGIRHPLIEAGLDKADVRTASRALGLPTWDRPASPCLSSRFPYGTRITLERLGQIGRAERVLRDLGLRELRVRWHDGAARIEVLPDDMSVVLAHRAAIVDALRGLGFTAVGLDLQGFRSGSLNEGLPRQTHKGPGAETAPAPRLR